MTKKRAKKAIKKAKSKPKEKTSAGTESTTAKQPISEPKPDFEDTLDKLDQELSEESAGPPKKDGRGGAREGSGRPRGVTDDFAAVNRLPEKANLTLVPVLQIPFKFWAKSQQLKELELKDKEAEELALPVTKLLEFYFPGRIPEIAWIWLMMLGTTYRIMEPRMDLLVELRKTKKGPSVTPAGKVPDSSSSNPAPNPSGPAQPAAGYPKEEKNEA